MLLKNANGNKSVSFTMMITSFIVVTLWLLVSIVSKIGHIEIRQFSGTEAALYLGPIMSLYWGRRWQEMKAGNVAVAAAATVATAAVSSTDSTTSTTDTSDQV